MKNKQKLISHTGTGLKIIINLKVAEEVLDDNLLQKLNKSLTELNHVQETKLK